MVLTVLTRMLVQSHPYKKHVSNQAHTASKDTGIRSQAQSSAATEMGQEREDDLTLVCALSCVCDTDHWKHSFGREKSSSQSSRTVITLIPVT